MSKIIATYAERRMMEELIAKNTTFIGDNDERDWNKDWNFERVAKYVNPGFNASHAKYVANALGWKIDSAPVPSLEDRVATLERQMTELRAELGIRNADSI